MSVNTKVEEWKKRLLDIGRTNKLINYKELRVGSITITDPGYREIFNTLYNEHKAIEFVNKSSLGDSSLRNGEVLSSKSDSELKKSLDNLRLKAKNSLEEQGVNVLYIAIGFLEWRDREGKDTKSPILLFPVNIHQGNIIENTKVKLAGDEVVLNPALQLKFENEYRITIDNITEEDLLDIDLYFENFRKRLNNENWSINMQVELGAFSFQKISMYKDFDELENEAIDNKIIAAITGEDVDINSEEDKKALETAIDSINPNEVYQVLDADSSQQEAILAAKNGLSFVMQGPPGTGKSQTITNIISECLSTGKSVLFVSEKLAALNVVYNRLKLVGLEEFCLQLHSNKSNKKDIIKELADALSIDRYTENTNYSNTLNGLYELRKELNTYISELHRIIQPFGKSLYDVYGIFSEYSDVIDVDFECKDIENLEESDLSDIDNMISTYNRLQKLVNELTSSIWEKYCLEEINELDIKNRFNEFTKNVDSKTEILNTLRENHNIDINNNLVEFFELAELLNELNKFDIDEIMLSVENNLEEFIKILDSLDEKYKCFNEKKKLISAKYTDDIYYAEILNNIDEFIGRKNEYGTFIKENSIKLNDINELIKIDNNRFDFIINYVEEVQGTVNFINDKFKLKLHVNINELCGYKALFDLILKVPNINEELLDNSKVEITENLINEFKTISLKSEKLKNELYINYDKDILDLDVKTMLVKFRTDYSSGFKILKSEYRRDVKLIKGVYKGNDKLTDDIILKALELCKEIKDVEDDLEGLKNNLKSLLNDRFLNEYTNWNSINDYIAICKNIIGELKSLNIYGDKAVISALCKEENIESIDGILEKISYISNNNEIFNKDIAAIQDNFEIEKNISYIKELVKFKDYFNSIYRELIKSMKDGEYVNFKELGDDVASINKVKQIAIEIDAEEKLINNEILLRKYDDGNITDSINMVTKSIKFKEYIKGYINDIDDKLIDIRTFEIDDELKVYISENINTITNVMNSLKDSMNYIESLVETRLDCLNIYDDSTLKEWIEIQVNNIENIKIYRDYRNIKKSLTSKGFNIQYIDELFINNNLETILDGIKKKLIKLWIYHHIKSIETIRDFSRETYDFKIKNFKVKDKEQLIIAKERLKYKLSMERPNRSVFGYRDNEINLLMNEANKKRMHLPIRKLFSNISNLLFKIKPCFLMSPLAVSSFLDINKIKFDVVIFDEASQICPEDALGSMLRSKQVIIVGDSEQLPPTNFFTTTVGNSEFNEDESQDLHESILDKCTSIMPTINLKWHYRSRHEDLIAFSNNNIYKNLITIPSSEKSRKNFGVEFIKVEDACYERSGARVNRKEAKAVAKLVFEHFKESPDKSLGIVTFSESQSHEIESAIKALRYDNDGYEQFFSEDNKEPFFIKNIESVQGDERDVIIFSIGYGKDANGSMSMNFGPLSRNGGYRRLNVAITRAKYNVKVVSSIEPSDIDLSRTNSEGVRMLKSYMEFAKGEVKKEDDDIANIKLKSTVEKAVYEFLIKNGYEADTYVGSSEYKINIAVKHPSIANKYILAIELDGYSYNNKTIARERYRLREELLCSMGWNFYRVWSTEWVRDRKTIENELLELLKDIVNQDIIATSKLQKEEVIEVKEEDIIEETQYEDNFMIEQKVVVEDDIMVEQKTLFENAVITEENIITEEIELKEEALNDEEFENNDEIKVEETVEIEEQNEISYNSYLGLSKEEKIEAIVRNEYPVHISRVCSLMGANDKGVVTNSYTNDILKFILVSVKTIEIRDKEFLWIKDSNKLTLRTNLSYKRELHQICKEEIALAMIEVLKKYGHANKELLFSETIKLFNIESGHFVNKRYLINAIDLLFEEGKITLTNGQIVLKDFEIKSINDEEKVNPDDFIVENIFKDDKFKSFLRYCNKENLKFINEVTDTHINKFRWQTLINKEVLYEINKTVRKYRDNSSKSNV